MQSIYRDGFTLLTETAVFTPSGGQFGGGAAPEPYRGFFGIGDPTPIGGDFGIGKVVTAELGILGTVELFRARLFGDLRATFGIEVTAAFDPGSIDAVLPYHLSLGVPVLDPVADAGRIVALDFAGTPEFDANSGFTTSFPSLRFQIDLVAALDMLLAAELGVGGRSRTYVLADFLAETKIPLISVDTARQTTTGAADPINVLGVTTETIVGMAGLTPALDANGNFAGISIPLNTFVSAPETQDRPKSDVDKDGGKIPDDPDPQLDFSGIDLGSIAVFVPSINTVSRNVNGIFVTDPTRKLLNGVIVEDLDGNGRNIGEGNKDDLAALTLDLDGIVTFATGGLFPPLELELGTEGGLAGVNFSADFCYNLFYVELDAALPLVQEFTLTPALRTRLSFFERTPEGGKGAAKSVDVVQVERQLLFDPTGVFRNAEVEAALRQLASDNAAFARDIDLFVDFANGIPAAFTGETAGLGGRIVQSFDGGLNWQAVQTETVLARSAPALGEDQMQDLDLSGLVIGYRIIRGSGTEAETEIVIPIAFDRTDSLWREQTVTVVSALHSTPFLPDIGVLNLRYDGATTFVEVETQSRPLVTNRTGLEFDLSLLLSGLGGSAAFEASVDVGPFTVGAGLDLAFGPLFRQDFPLLNLDIIDLYNRAFHITDSHVSSFVLGAPPPPPDYGDAIVGTPGADTLDGTAGNDQIIGLDGNDVLRGSDGDDTLLPGEGSAMVEGGRGSDVLDVSDQDGQTLPFAFGRVAAGTRFGALVASAWPAPDGLGPAIIRPDFANLQASPAILWSGIEILRLTDWADIFESGSRSPFNAELGLVETLDGDDMIGLAWRDATVRAGEGNDYVIYTPGLADPTAPTGLIDGGQGEDWLEVGGAAHSADLALGLVSDGLRIVGIENLGSATTTTNLRLAGDAGGNRLKGGSAANDTLLGRAGNDTIEGEGGNDLLLGGPGADSIMGGLGIDTVSYADAPTSVFIDLDVGGTGRGYRGDAQGDVLAGIEYVLGTAFDDILIGSAAEETLEGGTGNDRLAGQGGRDRLLGGEGDDILAREVGVPQKNGSNTFNIYDGGAGFDLLSFEVEDEDIYVHARMLSGRASIYGADAVADPEDSLSIDSYVRIEGIIGTRKDDRIFGDGADNALFGNGGDDYIEGAGGNDRLGFGEATKLSDTFSFPGGDPNNPGGTTSIPAVLPIWMQLLSLDPDATIVSSEPLVSVGPVRINTSFDPPSLGPVTDLGSFLWGGAGSDTLDLRFDRGVGFYPSTPPTARAAVDLDAGPVTSSFPGVSTISFVTGERVVYGVASWLNASNQIIDRATLFGIENVIGGARDDTIRGDGRDNVIEGMAGGDTMDGRGGSDILSYALAPEGVGLNLVVTGASLLLDNRRTGKEGGGHARNDHATNFESVVGSAHADTMLLELPMPGVTTFSRSLQVPIAATSLFGTTTYLTNAVVTYREATPSSASVFAFDLGAGDDRVTVAGVGGAIIDLGAGDDLAFLDGFGATIRLGAGNDTLTVRPLALPDFIYGANWPTTVISGEDGDDLDTVVFEDEALTQLVLTPTGARVIHVGSPGITPASVRPQELLSGLPNLGTFGLEPVDPTPIDLTRHPGLADVHVRAAAQPAIVELVGIERVVIGGQEIRLDSLDPVVQADRTLVIAEDSREAFALGARATEAEIATGVLYRLTVQPVSATLLRGDGSPLTPGDLVAAADLAGLLVVPGQSFGTVPDSVGFVLDAAPSGSPDRIVALPLQAPVAGIALGIAAPFDPLGNPLTIRVTELPTAGTVFFLVPDPAFAAIGMTMQVEQAVGLGDLLTPDQVAGLHFRAPANGSGDFGAFAYVAETGLGFRELAGTSSTETALAGVDVAARDGRASQRIAIDVAAVNDAPSVATLLYPLSPGGTLEGQVVASDPEGDGFVLSVVTEPRLGTLSFAADGSFTYVQDAPIDFGSATHVEDEFTIRASETAGSLVSAATVQVLRIVNPALWAPIVFDVGRPDVFFDGQGNPIRLGGLGTDDVIIGHAGPDQLFGFGGDDSLVGDGGDDTLRGDDGDDTLEGGPGVDLLEGGDGDDLYVVDAADIAVDTGGRDTVRSGFDHVLASGLEDLLLVGNAVSGIGNTAGNRITGNDLANSIAGLAGDDMLHGGGGNDTLIGGHGADTLAGGTGSDRYVVETIGDVVLELPGEGNDIVFASLSWTLGANIERLAFSDTGDFVGTGNALANRITGNAGANLLQGAGGNDRLSGQDGADTLLGQDGADSLLGGSGRDVLRGGAGEDWFLFDSAGDGIDRIFDFTPGVDTIGLSQAAFGGLALGMLDPINFVAHASNLPTSAFGTPQIIYNTAFGALFFDPDGVGGTGRVRLANLDGAPALSASDVQILV